MIFAYVDETGDPGPTEKKGASACYGLGCVMVPMRNWASGLERMVAFRREVRDRHGVRVRDELKSNFLVSGRGTLTGLDLPPYVRRGIFSAHLKQMETFGAKAFSVVVDKAKHPGEDFAELAWETLLQRLERTSKYSAWKVKPSFLLVHDEGDDLAVRKRVRKARVRITSGSAFGGAGVKSSVPIVEDAIPRDSSQSYFLQLADMVAYAGWRTHMKPGSSVAKVVDQRSWNHLGGAVHSKVNSLNLNGSVPGVVLR